MPPKNFQRPTGLPVPKVFAVGLSVFVKGVHPHATNDCLAGHLSKFAIVTKCQVRLAIKQFPMILLPLLTLKFVAMHV